jgi:hypothetical protein
MRVRAISLASARSNVVGALEVECSAEGLSFTYVDAALLSEEGIPVAIDAGRTVSVPWSRVRDARVLGRAVAFEIDPTPWPTQKLLLVRFEASRSTSPHRVFRRRLVTRALGLGLAVIVTLISSMVMPRTWPEMGWRIAVSIAALLGLVVVALGATIDRLVATGGLRSRIVRELFIGELLDLVPALPRDPDPVTTRYVRWPRVGGALPRATLVVSLSLASLPLIAAAYPRRTPSSEPPAATEPAPSAAPTGSPIVPLSSYVQILGPCDCPHDEGPLGKEPLPRVSLLTLSSRSFLKSGRNHLEIELAAVNNGSRDISELATVVEFFEKAKPADVSVRAVYHQTLVSGAAVKWRVEAEGDTVRIRAPTSRGGIIDGSVGHDGEGAAPTSALAELLDARNVPVRLHGAMMLAFLDDPHAKELFTKLDGSLGDAERAYLDRLIEVVGTLRTCRVDVAGDSHLSACIVNVGDARAAPVEIKFRALAQPRELRAPLQPAPDILTEWSLGVPGGIDARRGIEVRADVDLASVSKPPKAFEAYVWQDSTRPQ